MRNVETYRIIEFHFFFRFSSGFSSGFSSATCPFEEKPKREREMNDTFREDWKREAKCLEDEAIIKSQWESYVKCDQFHSLTDKRSITLGVRQFLSKIEDEDDFCADPTMEKVTKQVISRGYGLMKHVEAYMWRSDERSQKEYSNQIRSIREAVIRGMNRTLGRCIQTVLYSRFIRSTHRTLPSLKKNIRSLLY